MRDAEEPGSAATTLRLMLAWGCLALGVLNLSMGVKIDADGPYLVFHVVLLLTGLVLMGWGRLGGPPARAALAAGGLVAVAGLGVGALTGFPFPIGGWDVVFWACAGVLVVAVVTVARPRRADPAHAAPTHGEHRATAEAPVPRDENVGGRP